MRKITIIAIAAFYILFTSQSIFANDFTKIKGTWQCTLGQERHSLVFKSSNQLALDGEVSSYYIAPGVIFVQEDYGIESYFYTLKGSKLMITNPDGSVSKCQRGKAKKVAKAQKKSAKNVAVRGNRQSTSQGWPPPYAKPQGRIDENNPGAQALLYKFAGRWAYVSSNTLTNIYLKPDGTYEDAYESSYSGTFSNQGGNWGAAGSQQSGGRWWVEGGLRQGKLILVDKNGSKHMYNYRVHIERGEVYWGEYYFNSKLYSVKYIYR
jgi:hypothetical protein